MERTGRGRTATASRTMCIALVAVVVSSCGGESGEDARQDALVPLASTSAPTSTSSTSTTIAPDNDSPADEAPSKAAPSKRTIDVSQPTIPAVEAEVDGTTASAVAAYHTASAVLPETYGSLDVSVLAALGTGAFTEPMAAQLSSEMQRWRDAGAVAARPGAIEGWYRVEWAGSYADGIVELEVCRFYPYELLDAAGAVVQPANTAALRVLETLILEDGQWKWDASERLGTDEAARRDCAWPASFGV